MSQRTSQTVISAMMFKEKHVWEQQWDSVGEAWQLLSGHMRNQETSFNEREQRRDVLGDRADSSLPAFHSLNPSTSHPLNKTSDLLGRLQNTTMCQRTTLTFVCSSILPFCHKWGIFPHVNLMSTVSVLQEGRRDTLSIFRSVMKC